MLLCQMPNACVAFTFHPLQACVFASECVHKCASVCMVCVCVCVCVSGRNMTVAGGAAC